ncbi:MAG: glutathione S-transferase [Mariprofundaceae bacterium]
MPYPILYSFRRCPYAIRARLAIAYSAVPVALREVELKNKPAALLQASPKATVPVLLCNSGNIIDESRDIMLWALKQNDPKHWLNTIDHPLIDENDNHFKTYLDHYKYADRFPDHPQAYYRQQCELFLNKLEKLLANSAFIQGNTLSYADTAIFPFIRQFSLIEPYWFKQASYPYLQTWLEVQLTSTLFANVMQKYSPWQAGNKAVIFPQIVS